MRKYVVSSTLRNPEWKNTEVIGGDPVAEITLLKEQPGMDTVQYGFGRLSRTLMEHDCSTSCVSGSTRSSSARADRMTSSTATSG